ncbi:MAG: hypothetical protein KGI25_03545 [Thaumarchaeota archaeon]|nr:hypothetical protein [Nitrososphaerota archaeon]
MNKLKKDFPKKEESESLAVKDIIHLKEQIGEILADFGGEVLKDQMTTTHRIKPAVDQILKLVGGGDG